MRHVLVILTICLAGCFDPPQGYDGLRSGYGQREGMGPGRSTNRDQRAHLSPEEAAEVNERFRQLIRMEAYHYVAPAEWNRFLERNRPLLTTKQMTAKRTPTGNYVFTKAQMLELFEATNEIPDRVTDEYVPTERNDRET